MRVYIYLRNKYVKSKKNDEDEKKENKIMRVQIFNRRDVQDMFD
jgi:hypothetical protein